MEITLGLIQKFKICSLGSFLITACLLTGYYVIFVSLSFLTYKNGDNMFIFLRLVVRGWWSVFC